MTKWITIPVLLLLLSAVPRYTTAQIVITNDSAKASLVIGPKEIKDIRVSKQDISIQLTDSCHQRLQEVLTTKSFTISINGKTPQQAGMYVLDILTQLRPDGPVLYYARETPIRLGSNADVEISIGHIQSPEGKKQLLSLQAELVTASGRLLSTK